MKKLLFMAVICLLASASPVSADNYFTLLADNAEVINDTTIRLNPNNESYYKRMYAAAHFDGYLDHWYLKITHPVAMPMPIDSIYETSGMNVPYINIAGAYSVLNLPLLTKVVNDTATIGGTLKYLSYFSSTITESGYWDPDNNGNYQSYGTAKWGPCEFEPMFSFCVLIPQNTMHEVITLDATLSSTSDARGVTTVNVPHAVRNIHILVAYKQGDVNGDGLVNMSDVYQLVDWLSNGFAGATNYQIAACDVNGDGQINLTDLSCLIDLQGGFQS